MKPLPRLLWMASLVLAMASASLASEPNAPESTTHKSKAKSAETRRAKNRAARKRHARKKANAAAAADADQTETVPALEPVPPTTGSNGLFTLESGEPLPRKTIATTAGVNKFSRAPGSVTVLNTVLGVAVGLNNRLSLFLNFNPLSHLHVIRPTELSLNPITLGC